MLENNFEIPDEIMNCDTTNFLGTDFTTYGQVQKTPLSDVAASKSESQNFNQDKLCGIAISGKHLDAKQGDAGIVESQPKIGRLPIKRLNSKQDIAPSIRGDRVRGSTKRVLSDKVIYLHWLLLYLTLKIPLRL